MRITISTRQFQFTPLREGRLAEAYFQTANRKFQFTPLREGRLVLAGTAAFPAGYFNSRPSARGDRMLGFPDSPAILFQFTPLREGRRRLQDEKGMTENISIHAPPRGATIANYGFYQDVIISIHAPPRGATVTADTDEKVYIFQFTPLREGRLRQAERLARCVQFQFTPLREGRPRRLI